MPFSKKAFSFFQSLRKNNRREWFLKHKTDYEELVVAPAQALAFQLSQESSLKKMGFHFNPKKAIFRIYRDVRFSKDKSPYKTHCALALTRSGARDDPGVLYFHMEPKKSFVAAGFWHPDPKLQTYFRLWMSQNTAQFKTLVSALARHDLVLESEEALKRLPKGFEDVESPFLIPYLKLKNYVVSRELSDTTLTQKNLVKEIVKFARDAKPFLSQGWALVDNWRREGGDINLQRELRDER